MDTRLLQESDQCLARKVSFECGPESRSRLKHIIGIDFIAHSDVM